MSDYRLKVYRGRYCAVWTQDGKTRRVSLGTDDKEIASREFEVFKATVNRPDAQTVSDIWELCRAEYEGRPTGDWLRHGWKAIGPVFGDLLPEHITHQHCVRYIEQRRSNGISDTTIFNELNHLNLTLRWAMKRNLIDKVPHIQRPSKPPPRERSLSRAEASALLGACSSPHLWLFTVIGLQTGARTEAILELTWQRVDFEEGKVDFRFHTGSRRKGRAVVPMSTTLRSALKNAHQDAATPWVIEYGGKKISSIKTAFRAAVKKAGLTDVTPHVLRHTAGRWMAEAGVSMTEIAAFLGHEDDTITQRVYAKYSPNALKGAASALDLVQLNQ